VVNNRNAKRVRVIPISQILTTPKWETFFSFGGYDKVNNLSSLNKFYEDPEDPLRKDF
jgi:hypothetical protein